MIAGIALLIFGADKLSDSASHLAHRFGISPIVIGMTIVAIGTSIPEITNAAISMSAGVAAIGFGDVIGSDLIQITLILGIVALVQPLKANRKQILIYGLASIAALLLALAVIQDGMINWVDGIILCSAYILFVVFLLRNKKHVHKQEFKKKHNMHWGHLLMVTTLMIALVIAGSKLVIYSVTNLAAGFNIPTYIMAFVVVGLGTSLPELFVALSAARKKQLGLSVGTILGSNVTDPTLSLGFGALFTKGAAVGELVIPHIIFLLAASAVIIGVFAWKRKITRPMAIGILLIYASSFLLLIF